MPDPARSHAATPANKAEPNKPTGPLWARAIHLFYDPIFDIRSAKAFQSALNDYVLLPADERAFHETHLLYRLVQGLESVHGVLRRIETRLDGAVNPDLAALEHLEPIRAALEEIASNQPSLMQVAGWEGEEEEEEEIGEEEEELPTDDDPDGDDPDFIYDTVPEEEPERPRRPRRPSPSEAPRATPARAEPARAPEPEREALVGELVPANEGPQGGAEGDR